MGYSKSLSTLRQLETDLRLLASGTPCEWERLAEDADKFAYKLREALAIAARHAPRYPDDSMIQALAQAHKLFVIQVIHPRLVRAVYADITDIQREPTPVNQGHDPKHSVSRIRTVDDLMNAWHRAQPSNDKLHFPQAELSDEELRLAAQWAASLTPPWMLLRPPGTNALTLAKDDPAVPAAAKISGGLPKKRESADDPGVKLPTTAKEPLKPGYKYE